MSGAEGMSGRRWVANGAGRWWRRDVGCVGRGRRMAGRRMSCWRRAMVNIICWPVYGGYDEKI